MDILVNSGEKKKSTGDGSVCDAAHRTVACARARLDVLVVGGGAAGLAAALSAAAEGARVTVLEKEDRPGKKLLKTGNGRCNLMNVGPPAYFNGEPLALSVLGPNGPDRLRAFLSGCGLRVMSAPEEDGRVYPASGQAASVLDALRFACARRSVRVFTGRAVTGIQRTGDAFRVRAGDEVFTARRVIAACGSPAGVRDREGAYHLLTALGHRMIPLIPALCPLECDMRGLGALKGLRVPAVLTLKADGIPVTQAGGEALLSESGVSGIAAMQLSCDAAARSAARRTLSMDFSPLMDLAPRTHFHRDGSGAPPPDAGAVKALLDARLAILPRGDLFTGLLPRVLAEVIDRDRPEPRALARRLTAFEMTVTGVRASAAQVMRGGIDTAQFDPLTLESLPVPGLYCAGEMLDVDGDCGGFNLMFAFLSGIAAGRAAARGRAESFAEELRVESFAEELRVES